MEHDFEQWKLTKFVKDEADQEAVKIILIENAQFIKDMFLVLASGSKFP
jgi:hypothetical protein